MSGMIVAPRHGSHPDCRAPLTQIDAPHRVSINGAQPLSGVSTMTAELSQVLKALKVKTPSQTQQLSPL